MQSEKLRDVLGVIGPGGCLQPYVESFAAQLISGGYSVLSTQEYARSATHLGRWLDSCAIDRRDLTEKVFERFVTHKCSCPGSGLHGKRRSRRHVVRAERFVEYLRRQEVVPSVAAPETEAAPIPLVGFCTFMMNHRGITKRTTDRYEKLIKKMLPALGDDPGLYDAALVRRVLLTEVGSRSRVYAKTFVTALRAFLRFLAVEGRCVPHLEQAVPTIPEWKLSALPRYLEADDVDRVIASCDGGKPHGVRDRAVLLLLARLGLRAGDIIDMRLDDLDWDAGTVRVRGKGRKEVRLPLPQDAGDALIKYLTQVRPVANTDRVFLCANAPLRPFTTSTNVSDIVRLALKRAGIANPPSKGAHLLRHSAATAMLRSGASLDAIATVLRHQSSDTTAYYAKVDIALLQHVAQPWPEGAPC